MTIDLAVFEGQKPDTTVRYATPDRLQGSGKLVVRFASLFLSDYDATRDRGTTFCAMMLKGAIRTNAQIQQYFALAAAEIKRQLGDQSALPSTEQLQRISLTDFNLVGDTLMLRVTLGTADGTVDIQLPVGP